MTNPEPIATVTSHAGVTADSAAKANDAQTTTADHVAQTQDAINQAQDAATRAQAAAAQAGLGSEPSWIYAMVIGFLGIALLALVRSSLHHSLGPERSRLL